jgi:Zinc carboxypeptidase
MEVTVKEPFRVLRTGLAVLGLWALASPAAAAPSHQALTYQDYHSFAEVDRQLQEWSREHAREMQLLAIGRSAGGRPLYVARIAAPGGGGDPGLRPAVFVGANLAGFHNTGTEAALDLIRTLLTAPAGSPAAQLLGSRTFYVAPALNPDAHDALFATPRGRRSGNAMKVDHDVDGLEGEDPADDLNGDGVITRLRIADPTGVWLADATDPRVLVEADALERRPGAYRVVVEGRDDDGDGELNEDGTDGIWPDQTFPHAFPYSTPTAGPWSSFAPETKALMDFLLGRRNVALAVVYGPANNLLAAPESLGGGGDLGTQKFKVPKQGAESLGFDPEQEYTIDEIWEVARNYPFVRENNITKEQLQQFLGAGAATKVDPADQAWFDKFAESYKKRLEQAGLSAERPGAQYGKGGFTPWLYYQYGAVALELDVWGIPKPAAPKAGAGEGKPGEAGAREREVMAWVEANAPGGFVPWTPVTLPGGTQAEAGGLDPFVELNPPPSFLQPALAVHPPPLLPGSGGWRGDGELRQSEGRQGLEEDRAAGSGAVGPPTPGPGPGGEGPPRPGYDKVPPGGTRAWSPDCPPRARWALCRVSPLLSSP